MPLDLAQDRVDEARLLLAPGILHVAHRLVDDGIDRRRGTVDKLIDPDAKDAQQRRVDPRGLAAGELSDHRIKGIQVSQRAVDEIGRSLLLFGLVEQAVENRSGVIAGGSKLTENLGGDCSG